MAYVFNPPMNPSFPLDIATRYALNIIAFGDRYVQRSTDGINGEIQEVNLTWENLTLAERDAILAFFRARMGVQAFTCSFMTGGRRFVCSEFGDRRIAPQTYMISAKLEQVFDP